MKKIMSLLMAILITLSMLNLAEFGNSAYAEERSNRNEITEDAEIDGPKGEAGTNRDEIAEDAAIDGTNGEDTGNRNEIAEDAAIDGTNGEDTGNRNEILKDDETDGINSESSGENKDAASASTGAYTLALYPKGTDPLKIEANEGSQGIVEVELYVSGSDVDLINPYIRISLPKDSNVDIGISGVKQGVMTRTKTSFEGENKNFEVIFNNLKGGDRIKFFLLLSFKEGMVPDGYTVPIKAQLCTSEAKQLTESNEVKIQAITALPTLYKSVSSEASAGSDEGGYIGKATPVKYTFFINKEGNSVARNVSKLTIKDKLPTYTAKDGTTKTAVIAAQSKSKWRLSDDGSYAVYDKGTDFYTSYYSNYYFDSIELYLEFPDAKVGSTVENTATAILEPYQRKPGESDMETSAKAKCKLTAGKQKLNIGSMYKAPPAQGTIEDVIAEKEKSQDWTVNINPPSGEKFKSIAMTETPDKNLYIESISSNSEAGNQLLKGIVNIKGILPDGTEEDCAYTTKKTGFFSSTMTLTLKNSQKYDGYKFVFNDSYVYKPETFGNNFVVKTKFKDPASVSAKNNPNGFKNIINFTADTEDGTKYVDYTAEGSFMLKPYESKYGLDVKKGYDSSKITTLTPWRKVSIEATPMNTVPYGSKVTGRKLVVILPDAMNLNTGDPFVTPVYSDNGIKSYKVVDDYNGSGKRALVIELPDLKKGNLVNSYFINDDNTVKIALIANDYLSTAPVKVPVYYTFAGIGDSEFDKWHRNSELVDDKYNIIEPASEKIPMGYVEWNSLPAVVLRGKSLVGHTPESMSPYSISVTSDTEHFLLGMEVENYENDSQKDIALYTVLPHKGDKNIVANQAGQYLPIGSNTDVVLTEPIIAPEGYTVKYLLKTPPQNPNDAIASPDWLTDVPADLSAVKAIMLVSNPGTILKKGQNIELNYSVKAENIPASPKIVTTFAYKTSSHTILTEANSAYVTLPVSFNIEKIWKDYKGNVLTDEQLNDLGDKVPESIKVKIIGNKKTLKEIELTKKEQWKKKINDLPRYDGNKEIKYSFEEIAVDGWKTGEAQLEDKNVTIVNQRKLPLIPLAPAKTKIAVTKEWQDYKGDSLNKIPVSEIEVELYRDGKGTGKRIRLNEENHWKGEFADLDVSEVVGDKAYKYTVKEVGEENNRITIGKDEYSVNLIDNGNNNYTLINKRDKLTSPWIPLRPAKTKIAVTKEWQDYRGDSLNKIPVSEIEVELYRDGEGTGKRIRLNEENHWKGEFADLDVSEVVGDKAYKYTVKEVGEENNRITIGKDGYSVNLIDNGNNNYTLVNKRDKPSIPWTPLAPAKTKIAVTKEWQDYRGDSLNKIPVSEIEVELYRDGEGTGKRIRLNEENHWKGEFADLDVSEAVGDKAYKYTVKEVGEENNRITIGKDGYSVNLIDNGDNNYTLVNKRDKLSIPWTPVVPINPPVPEEPSVPLIPAVPVTTGTNNGSGTIISDNPKKSEDNKDRHAPETGDEMNLSVYGLMSMISIMIVILMHAVHRRRNEEQ